MFKVLVSNPNARLYEFQRNVSQSLLSGRNVILSAPTGAGKTWAALIPYLKSKLEGKPLADRVFYALPLRSLATNLYHSTHQACLNVFQFTDNPAGLRSDSRELCISIQTGDQQKDRFFQGDICFTTIDQLLAGYLNLPLTLSPGTSNINAGSLIGSLIILDEIHLLEPGKSMATVMEMVARLKPYAQFVLMTATLSSSAIKVLQDHLAAEVISVADVDLAQIPSHRDKKRSVKWVAEPLTAEKILASHQGMRSIVVCNTVARAQQIYQHLKEICPGNCHLILLHSRYFPEDRRSKEQELGVYFGPKATKTNVILVATQVIEAGVDISADNLHTELCPANALLQRARRCARYVAPRNIGTVWVYELEQNANGKFKLGPYHSKEGAETIHKTREMVISNDGSCLNFIDEQSLINQVHAGEADILMGIRQTINTLHQKVDKAIDDGDPALARDLIRDVNSVNLILTSRPEDINFSRQPQMLSIPRTSLHMLVDYLEQENSAEPVGWYPVEVDEEGIGLSFRWLPLKNKNELFSAWLLAIPPGVADYSSELGLRLGVVGSTIPVRYQDKASNKLFTYHVEGYIEHARATMNVCKHSTKLYGKGCYLLEQHLRLPTGLVERLAEVICLTHDCGKLSDMWFSAAWAWQNDHYPEEGESYRGQPLAHITFNPQSGDQSKQKQQVYDRGKHAAEGAFMVAMGLYAWLVDELNNENLAYDLAQVTVSAIARHHSARLNSISEFKLSPDAARWVAASLEPLGIGKYFNELAIPQGERDKQGFLSCLISAQGNRKLMALYWYLVRRLRLADQGALASLGQGGGS